jgi:hypothetical protein
MILKRKLTLSCLSLLVALAASILGSAIADNNTALGSGTNWDGTYNTNVKSGGTQGQWETPSTLLVAWGKEVKYRGKLISKAKFFNNSSISWTGDSNWRNGQIWFTYGDNRSQYWPNGAVKGRVFAGWIQTDTGSPVDFRGINNTTPLNKETKCKGNCLDQTVTCKSCSNGKVCSNGQCVCPGGTSDCGGQCTIQAPCGGCDNGKICSNGGCVCPKDTKECNDQCIKVTECCGGCPPWKVCTDGKCICPPGVKDCPDPMPV